MYKNLEEVQAALAVRLPESELKDVNGYSYVPWEVTSTVLDNVFGPFGWSEEISNQHYDTERGIYIVSRRLTGYAEVTGGKGEARTVTIEREGVGCGITGSGPNATNTAIKKADSDSLSRAAKKLGDAFGRYLYDRDDPARQANHGNGSAPTRPAVQGTVTGEGATLADGKTLSVKQVSFLGNLGWSSQDIAGMTLARAKSIMENREKPTADALPF